jgi:hypothetical protein
MDSDTLILAGLLLFGFTLIALFAFKPKSVIIQRDSEGNIVAVKESW